MANIRCMFVGQGAGGLSQDRVVNTFHFSNVIEYPAHADNVSTAVQDFYNGVGGQNTTIAGWLSPWIQRAAELRIYNLADVKPRVPRIVPFTLHDVATSTGLPEEMAVVLTLQGIGLPITRRRRGRIYIGPLHTGASSAASSTSRSRPSATLQADLALAALRLSDFATNNASWCIRSTLPTENFVPVGSGYIDDAFDTQRRRGPDTLSRVPWFRA